MEEAEKLAALKKAYADIILNTAKEAAARIMVSERKALRFQQDLFAAKEEALNMLLRLKQMTDCKIAEVEGRSFSQTRRIEELEVQLHKAEDTVTDLRSQLKGVQDELENLKSNHVQPLDEEMIKQSAPSKEDASQAENCYADNPVLATIIMRSKEPELYRNGCTQRIRAFEGNLVNGELPLPARPDDQYSPIKNESIIREEEISEVVGTESSPKDENVGTVKKKPTGLEALLQQGSSCDNGQSVKVFHRFSSRKRRSRYRTAQVNSFPDQVIKASEPSILSRCETYPCPENTMVESGEDLPKTVQDSAQKTSDSHLTPVSSLNTADMSPQSRCMDGTGSDAKIKALLSVQSSVYEDKVLIDKSELSRQDREVADSSGDPTCKLNLDTVDVPSSRNCDPEEKKASEATNAVPSQAVNDKLLKYTFRRKRKKESLSCPDENKSLEKNTTKKRSGEKQNVAPEPQKSSLIIESSRDSRRLVQVARQLISLSEKRWW